MKKLFLNILAGLSKQILRIHKPVIVGITGSIGKTSAKQAALAVLRGKFKVRGSTKNYNNEFGLPFTIIGVNSPKRNPILWLWVFLKGFYLAFLPARYPEVLVLEMGVDHPGDMDKLVAIAPPDIAVLTTIGISHLENFHTQDAILEEKSKIFSKLSKSKANVKGAGNAILNFDDPMVASLADKFSKVSGYGFDSRSTVRILNYNLAYSDEEKEYGTEATFEIAGENGVAFFENSLGLPPVSAAAAGAAIGFTLGMTPAEIFKNLENYKSEPGRVQILFGKNNTLLIDDTYNAAPLSMSTALGELAGFKTPNFTIAKKVVFLGDMLELGEKSDSAHQEIGKLVRTLPINTFIGIGEKMKLAAPDAWYPDSEKAAIAASQYVPPDSVVLIKGSRGIAMEKIIKALK